MFDPVYDVLVIFHLGLLITASGDFFGVFVGFFSLENMSDVRKTEISSFSRITDILGGKYSCC